MTKLKQDSFLKTLDFLIEQSGLEEGPLHIALMQKSIDYWCTRCPKSAFIHVMEMRWDETQKKAVDLDID